MADRALRFDLLGRDRTLGRTLGQADRKFRGLGSTALKVGAVIGGAFAGIQVAGFLKGAIDEAREAAKVGRQTAAVIKATGGVAKVSAKDVDRLADALSSKVGVDDEVIAAGQNMLLTFKGVRNELGRGNDIFNQATAVALDMTAALNEGEISQKGLETSTIRLGKALNDPIKGVTALTRVGVTFTDKQKDQIKTLVESGRTMDAQKIILGELKSEFGGAAAAAADPWQRFGVLMDNIKERIGTVLLPALTNAFGFLTTTLIPAIERGAARVREAVGPAVAGLTGAVQEKFDTFKLDAKIFGRNLADRIKGSVQAVINGFLVGVRTGDWSQLGGILGNLLSQAIGNGADLFRRAFGGVDWFMVGKEVGKGAGSFALGFTFTMFDGIIEAFKKHPWEASLAAVMVVPFGKLGGILSRILAKIPFLRVLAPVFRGLESATGPLRTAAGKLGSFIGSGLREGAERVFPTAAKRVQGRIGDLGAWISLRAEWMRKLGLRLIKGLAIGIGQEVAQVVKDIGRVTAAVTRPFIGAGRWLVRRGMEAIAGLVRGIAAMVGSVGAWVGRVVSRATSPFRGAAGWLVGRGRDLVSGLVSGIRSAIGSVGGVLRSLKNAIVGGIKRLFGISSPSRVMAGLGGSIVAGLVRGLITNASSLRTIIKSISGNIIDWFGAIPGMLIPPGAPNPRGAGVVALAQRMAAGYGWGSGAQWNALYNLVQHESGWNPNAQNPTSTAYGLFQFLNSTWGSVGAVKTASAAGQIAAGLRYIKSRYGSPLAAWNFWQSHTPHWYAKGGVFTKPSIIGVGEAGPEAVVPLGRTGGFPTATEIAAALAAELRRHPPVVAVRDLQAGINAYAGRMGQPRPYR